MSLADRIRERVARLLQTSGMRHKVVVQLWDQVEPGWGRTMGGYSIHLTEADRLCFVAKERERDKNKLTYFVADGVPFVRYVDRAIYRKVKAGRNGIWWPDNSLPAGWGRNTDQV